MVYHCKFRKLNTATLPGVECEFTIHTVKHLFCYRPHPKDGEGNVFTLSTPGGGSGQSADGGGSGPAGGERGGQVSQLMGGGGVRSSQRGGGQVSQLMGGSGPAGGGVGSVSGGGGQHLAPSCGRYASCVHAGGLSCFGFFPDRSCWSSRMQLGCHSFFKEILLLLKTNSYRLGYWWSREP